MPTIVKIQGLKEYTAFQIRLPKEMEKEIGVFFMNRFINFVRKSARRRAPRWTGALAESIKKVKGKNKRPMLVVESPYGMAQELGFKPHFVQLWRSTRSGNLDVADWAASKGLQPRISIFVSKHKPFVRPAFEAALRNVPNWISKSTQKAIKQAGGKK